ncbi:hypothetical protein C0993_012540 [Termitomyces sp. T159_Od127]|nr:hypothetical protein C0993_012540 [Termitomyces sp. T159_Od127]
MPGNVGVMVLLDNPSAELWDVEHVDVVLEGQEPIPEGLFICTDQLGLHGVQKAMDKEMDVVEAGGAVTPPKGTMGQPRRGPSVASQALEAPWLSKTHQGQKPLLAASQLKILDFPANIPQQAEAAQMLFMKAIVFLAPPEQVAVVVVPTDLCTPVQYDGIVATVAAEKAKHHEAPLVDNNSNYGES